MFFCFFRVFEAIGKISRYSFAPVHKGVILTRVWFWDTIFFEENITAIDWHVLVVEQNRPVGSGPRMMYVCV